MPLSSPLPSSPSRKRDRRRRRRLVRRFIVGFDRAKLMPLVEYREARESKRRRGKEAKTELDASHACVWRDGG